MKYPPNYHRALKIQDALFADVQNPETTPAARAQLARAWDCLEERKRIIRMIPAPKQADVAILDAAKRKRNAPAQGFTETPVEKIKPAKTTTSQAAPSEPKGS